VKTRSRSLAVVAVVVLALSTRPAAADIGSCPVFPPDHILNTRVDTLPVHPRSAQYINSIGPPIILGAGPGGGPHVRATKLTSGGHVDLASFFAYPVGFAGGVFVASGSLLGSAKIVTGAGIGGGPHVRVFTGNGTDAGVSFFAYPIGFPGGVRVAVGDVNGDGQGDIVTAAGPGGGPHVRAFGGAGAPLPTSFLAY
jgi:hypothetical protein